MIQYLSAIKRPSHDDHQPQPTTIIKLKQPVRKRCDPGMQWHVICSSCASTHTHTHTTFSYEHNDFLFIFFPLAIAAQNQPNRIDQRIVKMARNNQRQCQGVRWHENYFSDLVSK